MAEDTRLTPLISQEELAEIEALSSEQLRAELAKTLKLTVKTLVKHLLRMAVLIRVLEVRGEDLSDLKVGLLDYVRLIAYGQLLPEVVAHFAGSPQLIRRIAALPLPEQERLARGEHVKLFVRRPDGTIDHILADPLRMKPAQWGQVFAPDHIRDQAEQVLLLEDRRENPTVKAPRKGRVRADRERGGILVGRQFVTPGDILAAVADLKDGGAVADIADCDPAELATVPVKLTEEEHQHLKVLAARSGRGVTMQDLIRRALRAAGLLGRGEEINDGRGP